jgi:hypothetical protein
MYPLVYIPLQSSIARSLIFPLGVRERQGWGSSGPRIHAATWLTRLSQYGFGTCFCMRSALAKVAAILFDLEEKKYRNLSWE